MTLTLRAFLRQTSVTDKQDLNGIFIRNAAHDITSLKRRWRFSSTVCRKDLKTQQSPVIVHLCLSKTRSGQFVTFVTSSFSYEKLRFQNNFRPHKNARQVFSNCSGLKSVFQSSVFVTGQYNRPNRRKKSFVFKFSPQACGLGLRKRQQQVE